MGSACGACKNSHVHTLEYNGDSPRANPPAQMEREERKRRIEAYRDQVFQQSEFEQRLQEAWKDEGLHKVMSVCEYLPVGVVMFTEDGTIGFVNDRVLTLAGRDKEGIRPGNHLSKLLTTPTRLQLEELCYKQVNTYSLHHVLGGQIPVAMYTVPLEVTVQTPRQTSKLEISASTLSMSIGEPKRRGSSNGLELQSDSPMVLVSFVSKVEEGAQGFLLKTAQHAMSSDTVPPLPSDAPPEYDTPQLHMPATSSSHSTSSEMSEQDQPKADSLLKQDTAEEGVAINHVLSPSTGHSPLVQQGVGSGARPPPPRLILGDLVTPTSHFPLRSARSSVATPRRDSSGNQSSDMISLGDGSPKSSLSGNLRRPSLGPSSALSSPRGSVDAIATITGLVGDIILVLDPVLKVVTQASLAAHHLLGLSTTEVAGAPFASVLHQSEQGDGDTQDTLSRIISEGDDKPDRVCLVTDPVSREGMTVLVASVLRTAPNSAVLRLSTLPSKAKGIRFKRDSGVPEELACLVDSLAVCSNLTHFPPKNPPQDATIITTLSGQILHHNSTFGVMFECDLEDVLNKDISVFVPAPIQRAHMDHVRRLLHVKNRAQRKYLKRHRAVIGQTLRGTTMPLDITVTEMVFSKETVFYVATMRRMLTTNALAKYHSHATAIMHQLGVEPPADFCCQTGASYDTGIAPLSSRPPAIDITDSHTDMSDQNSECYSPTNPTTV